jgi:LysM repeat protein
MMQTFVVNLLLPLGIASTASATVLLYPDSLPSTLTSACTDALTIDVTACDPLVRDLRTDIFYPPASLSRICTTDCSSALETWLSSVQSGCGNQTISADLEVEAAAVYIPGALQYSFQHACLKDDSGRFCGPVAALAAAFSDPGINPFNYISNITDQVRPDNCDACLAERLRLREGSPYFDGPIVASMSLYESMTASCSIVGRPVVTTTIDYFTAAPAPTAKVCEGSTYTIKASDDCYTISKSQGVGTNWLLADNDLEAFCTDFPAAGSSLCITNQCTTVTVPTNATCEAVAAAANITETQLIAWNPSISYGCANLPKMNGSEICVDAPGRKFVVPSDTSALPPLTPTTTAPKPTDAADGSGGAEKPCGRWYLVQQGDYCNLVAIKFGITLPDFLFLNPAVNANCTNLFALESYCVAAVGDINTYTSRPGFASVTLDPSAPFTGIPFTERPDATNSPYTRLYTPLPEATGTRDDCVHYFAGDDYQYNLTGSPFASNCELAAITYDVDLESFGLWNPGLGNVSDPACAFEKGVRYCGSWYLETAIQVTATPTNTSPTPPGPTMSGSPADCNEWAVVTDGLTCTDMASGAGISLEQFLAWNPAVSSDCATNYWVDEAYCVGVSGDDGGTSTTKPPTTSAPSSTSSTTSKPTPPGPTMTGSPADCNKWSLVTDGLSCTDMATQAGISLAQFLAWNPAVSSDCATNYWLGEAYCVGVAGGSTPTTTAKPTTGKPTPPAPTMSGEPDNCNEWAVVTDGLSCTDMASQAGLTLEQFLAWNPAVSSDCAINYWLGEAYCVGIAGGSTPTTTAKPTTGKPTPPAPTMSGEPDNCNKWAVVTDGLSCTDMASQTGLTLEQFLAWNPAVSSDCVTNYWLGEAYCVGVGA